jgi:hypothetical protein
VAFPSGQHDLTVNWAPGGHAPPTEGWGRPGQPGPEAKGGMSKGVVVALIVVLLLLVVAVVSLLVL